MAWSSRPWTLYDKCWNVTKELQLLYRHFYHLSSLLDTAQRGWQLYVLIRNKIDRETRTHSASDVLKLYFQVYPSAENGRIKYLSLWFHFLRVPKRAKYGDRIWEVKIIDLMFAHGRSNRKTIRCVVTFREADLQAQLILLTPDNNDTATVSHKITRNTGANENHSLIHHWLTNCTTKHQKCNHPPTRHIWMPTRLLDIGKVPITPSNKLSLVESVNIARQRIHELKPSLEPKATRNTDTSQYGDASRRYFHIRSPPDLSRCNHRNELVLVPLYLDRLIVYNTRFYLGLAERKWSDAACIQKRSVQYRCERGYRLFRRTFLRPRPSSCLDRLSGSLMAWKREPANRDLSFFHAWHLVSRGRQSPIVYTCLSSSTTVPSQTHSSLWSRVHIFECHELEACETFPNGLPPVIFDSRAITRLKSLST